MFVKIYKLNQFIVKLEVVKMGIFGDSEENNSDEQKTIDANGNVNNNIIIREANDTHQQMLLNEKLLVATYLLVAAEII